MNWYGMWVYEVEERMNMNVKVGFIEKEVEGWVKKFGINELEEVKRFFVLMVFLV